MKRLFVYLYFLLAASIASAAFSGHYLCYQFGDATYQNRLYTSTSDVGSHYMGCKIGGTLYYMMLGDSSKADVSNFRAKVAGTTYAGLQDAYAYYTKFGSTGSGNGQFNFPYGIYTGFWGVYVGDGMNCNIQVFGYSDLAYDNKFGSSGTGNSQFATPLGITGYTVISSPITDVFYVVDSGNNRVQEFQYNGSSFSYTRQFGSSGTGDGQFSTPVDITKYSSYLFVTDRGNNRVQKFGTTGVYSAKWGSSGSGDGQFNSPYGITSDSSGYIYVADQGNNRIQKFNSSGTYQTKWSVTSPYDVEYFNGYIFVSTTGGYIYKYSTSGTLLRTFASGTGSGDGQFNATGIKSMAFTSTYGEDVYAVDAGADRVQVFK